MVTFAVFLLLWIINWIGSFSGPTVSDAHELSVDHRPLRRLLRRASSTRRTCLLPELHHLRAVSDRQVGRQRTVARVNGRTESSVIIGWLGTALVVARRRRSASALPAQDQYALLPGAGRASSACCSTSLSQWREIAALFSRRQARYGTLAASSVLIVLGILVAINYIGKRQNKRWDLTASQAVQPVGSEPQRPRQARRAAADHGLRARTPSSSASATGCRNTSTRRSR